MAPAVHLSHHGSAEVDVESIDVDALRDPATGRVDLERLAAALSGHDESQPHQHGPGPEQRHGEGSLQHLMLALAGGAPVLATPLVQPVEQSVAELARSHDRVPALAFLSAQKAQAPPA